MAIKHGNGSTPGTSLVFETNIIAYPAMDGGRRKDCLQGGQ